MNRLILLIPVLTICLFLPRLIYAQEKNFDQNADYQQARQLSYSGKYEQAIEIFKKLVEHHPENSDYLLGLGQAYLWNNQAAQAIPWLEKGINLTPKYEDLYRVLSQAYENNNQHDDAEKIYKKANILFNNPSWARQAMNIHRRNKQTSYGVRLYNQLELLSYNDNDWRDTSLSVLANYNDGKKVSVSFVNSERFKLYDNTLAAEAYLPINANNNIYAELRYSGSHKVLPELSAGLQLTHSFKNGLGLFGGYRRVIYTESDVNIFDLGAEYYFSNYRLAYTSYISDSNTAGGALSHRFQAGYTFDTRGNIQLAVTTGSEVEKPVNAISVIKTDFTNIALWGDIILNKSWTFIYTVGYTDISVNKLKSSSRESINLGIQYNF